MWGPGQQLQVLFAKILKVMKHTVMQDELSIQVLLARLASMAWSIASKSTILGLPDLSWSSRFL